MSDKPRGYLPRVYRDLRTENPELARAYDALGDACRRAGPLSDREQRLVKLGLAVGLSSEGGVRSHVRRGLSEGDGCARSPARDHNRNPHGGVSGDGRRVPVGSEVVDSPADRTE